jgi:galactokinase
MTLTATLLKAKFRELFIDEPQIIVKAPGRVNLIGEHTDYNDGFVLPMAIDRAFWIALSPRQDGIVKVSSLDMDESEEFDVAHPAHKHGNWSEYLRGVAWHLTQQGIKLQGWNGVTAGDIPIGAGLSSSAAVELATARAFCAISNIDWRPVEMAKAAQRTEIEWVGVNCGIMDQLISAAGIAGHALLIDCRSLDFEAVPLPPETVVVVLDTSTRRGLVDSAYNERRRQCEQAAAFFGVPALRDVTMQDFAQESSGMPGMTQKRARHVISENERTLKAAEAMKAGDAVVLGSLMNESHCSLAEDFEVSNNALNAIVSLAQSRPECYGARMTGAGFGGCGVALVQKAGIASFTEFVVEKYRESTKLDAKLYICQAEDGACLI